MVPLGVRLCQTACDYPFRSTELCAVSVEVYCHSCLYMCLYNCLIHFTAAIMALPLRSGSKKQDIFEREQDRCAAELKQAQAEKAGYSKLRKSSARVPLPRRVAADSACIPKRNCRFCCSTFGPCCISVTISENTY